MTRQWIEPWYSIERDNQRAVLQQELRRELGERHILCSVPFVVIAARDDQDDILLEMPDGRIAEVHLTWSQHVENDPRWPRTEIYNTFDEWRDKRMIEQWGPDRV